MCDNDETPNDNSGAKIIFKKRKRPASFRASEPSVDDRPKEKEKTVEDEQNEDEEIDWKTLDELRTLQKARKRQTKGIDVLDLLKDNGGAKNDGEKVKEKSSGGLTDSRALARELDLGNTFSLETNRRDEDAELMRYVEEELAKRRAANDAQEESSGVGHSEKDFDPTRDLLIKAMPEHLLKLINENKSKNEEMLSSQMLSGIPEVDLGIEERIRNIEKTEAARTKLFEKRLQRELEKSDHGDQQDLLKDISFAPKNLSAYANRNQLSVMMSNNHPMPNHRFNISSVNTENKDLMVHFIEKEERKASGKYPHHQHQPQQPVQQYDIEPVVVIGDEPQKVRLPKPIDKDKRMPAKDKPMDNFVFEKFRKHLKKR